MIGRILYVIGYAKAVKDRSPGFAIQALAAIALWVGASAVCGGWCMRTNAVIACDKASHLRGQRQAIHSLFVQWIASLSQ